MLRWFVFSLLLLGLYGCGGNEVKEHVVDGRYAIDLPNNFLLAKGLNEEASLEYESVENDVYVIVIDKLKAAVHQSWQEQVLAGQYTEDLQGFARLVEEGIRANFVDAAILDHVDTIVHEMPAQLMKVKCRFGRVRLTYVTGVYEGREDYYQVMVWTRSSQEEKFLTQMYSILYSLREI